MLDKTILCKWIYVVYVSNKQLPSNNLQLVKFFRSAGMVQVISTSFLLALKSALMLYFDTVGVLLTNFRYSGS